MNKSEKTNRAKGDDSSRHAHIFITFTLVMTLVLIMAGAIIFMMVNTTLIHADDWNGKTVTRMDSVKVVVPQRGEIYADDGSILATNLQYYDLSIDFRTPRFMIVEYDSLVSVLADSLAKAYPYKGRTAAQWEAYLRRPIDEKPRKERPRGYLLLRRMPLGEVNRIKKNFPFFSLSKRADSTGLVASPTLTRVYPYGDMAKRSIGRTGSVNGSKGAHGISGLERALDRQLYGTEGLKRKVMLTNHEGYWTDTPAQRGCDVYSTINITIQDILEQELSQMLIDSHAQWGSAIIMEVATGDIKAISNLERDSVNGGVIEALNRAVLGYEPGSVAKVMSMAVALNEGYALPIERQLPIGRHYTYLKRNISDTHSPASLPVSRFIEYSSNIGMVKLTMPHFSKHPNEFRDRLADMGFFDTLRTGIAGECPPFYPHLREDANGLLNLSRMVFGYTTQIPPLYTCAFYNAIANGGRFVRPRLFSGMRLPDGRDSVVPVSYVRDQILSPEHNAILKKMIHEVVWGEGGTAKSLKDNVVEIAGKTGTCKIAREKPKPVITASGDTLPSPPFKGGYLDGRYRVTFCGFYPYENPKYTCIVVIQDPRGALRGPAASAGKVLKNVALKLYARGMLGNVSDYTADGITSDLIPTLYASHQPHRSDYISREYGINHRKVIRRPDSTLCSNVVPDVVGLGVREAVVKLEKAGLNVAFAGTGFVKEQQPAAGSPARAGQKVHLNLQQF